MRHFDRIWKAAVLAGALWCLRGGPLAAEPPAFVNWSNDGAYRETNGIRSLLTLNGWWQWKAADPKDAEPPADGWLWRKVPGSGRFFDVLGDDGKPAKGVSRDAADGPCWVRREFVVPAEWRNQEVALILKGVAGDGTVFLDGRKLGCTWSKQIHRVALPRPYKTGPYVLAMHGNSFLGPIWLAAHAGTGGRILDTYLSTSVRKKEASLTASGTGPADGRLRLTISEYGKPDAVVKTVGPLPLAKAGAGWSVSTTVPWADAKLWSLDRTNLYEYRLELLSRQGAPVDRTFPIRFGFREITIEGGYFHLNGRRITIVADIHSGLGEGTRNAGVYSDEAVWREALRRFRKIGITGGVYRWTGYDDDMIFRLADEEGFFLLPEAPYWGASDEHKAIPELARHFDEINRYTYSLMRHSPSVPFYFLAGMTSNWDYAPSTAGEDFDARELFGKDIDDQHATVARFDPVRAPLSSSYSGGGKSEPAHYSMNYIGLSVDVQEHANWPNHWYTKKNKPLGTYEMAIPPYIAEWYMRRSRGEQAHGTKGALPYFLENAAIYFGEDPYLTEPRENVARWMDNNEKGLSAGFPWKGAVKSYEKTEVLFARDVLRAWKTYGVNLGFFIQVREMFADNPLMIQPPKADPRRPLPTPDRLIVIGSPYLTGKPTAFGVESLKSLARLLVYVGGPDGAFWYKDRNYLAGETVRKALVMLNEYEEPVRIRGAWELVDPAGKVAASGTVPEVEVKPGEISPAKVPVEFPAPAVAVRTVFTLRVACTADKEGSLADEFPVTVFPAAPKPRAGQAKIALYDPAGDTAKLLSAAGLAYAPVGTVLPDPAGSLLVVGRNALKDEAGRKAFAALKTRGGAPFETAVAEGLRVVVFEQDAANVWGLQTEEARWRRTFIAAPGHPVFAGIEDGDLAYLRGDGNLTDPYPPWPASPNRIPADRFPHWGLDNVAVTRSIVRPQLGAARALAVCGFDLQEASLLEFACGRGRMLFCQVDVTNRYGIDPAATRLADNVLAYMAAAPAPDPSLGAVRDAVREGIENSPVPVKTERAYMAAKVPGPVSWGVTAADLYFQGWLELPLFQAAGGGKHPYILVDGEKTVRSLLNPRLTKTKWQRMKMMQVRSALVINQGGSSETFPAPTLQGDKETLYPVEWMEGFVHPYLLMQW